MANDQKELTEELLKRTEFFEMCGKHDFILTLSGSKARINTLHEAAKQAAEALSKKAWHVYYTIDTHLIFQGQWLNILTFAYRR